MRKKTPKLFSEIPVDTFFWFQDKLYFKIEPLKNYHDSPNAKYVLSNDRIGYAKFEDSEIVLKSVKK